MKYGNFGKIPPTAVLIVVLIISLFCGCEDKSKVTVYVTGMTVIPEADIRLHLPKDWNIYVGDKIYEENYSRYSEDFRSAEDMKKELEDNGERYIVYAEAPNGNALALFSSQTPDGDMEVSVEDLARTTHDTTVFDYKASDYYLYTESEFSEKEWGGVSGWLSEIKVAQKQGEEFVIEQKEFLFEKEGVIYSLKIFTDSENSEQAEKIDLLPA